MSKILNEFYSRAHQANRSGRDFCVKGLTLYHSDVYYIKAYLESEGFPPISIERLNDLLHELNLLNDDEGEEYQTEESPSNESGEDT